MPAVLTSFKIRAESGWVVVELGASEAKVNVSGLFRYPWAMDGIREQLSDLHEFSRRRYFLFPTTICPSSVRHENDCVVVLRRLSDQLGCDNSIQ